MLRKPVLPHDLTQAARLVDRLQDARLGLVGVAVVAVRHEGMAVHDLAGDVVVGIDAVAVLAARSLEACAVANAVQGHAVVPDHWEPRHLRDETRAANRHPAVHVLLVREVHPLAVASVEMPRHVVARRFARHERRPVAGGGQERTRGVEHLRVRVRVRDERVDAPFAVAACRAGHRRAAGDVHEHRVGRETVRQQRRDLVGD